MHADLILRGGRIIDGLGGGARPADIAVTAERIVAVGDLATATAADVIDVTGWHVAPGFVDLHSHSDTAVIADPANAPKIRQGITFEVIGQDGLGVAPYAPDRDAAWRRSLLPLTGHADLHWSWRSFADHLDAIDAAAPATNVGALVAFGSIRNAVIGLANRAPTAGELATMQGLVGDAMAAGAFGMSVGLVYPPAVFAAADELAAAFRVVGLAGGLMVVHLRSQGDAWLAGIDEAIAIARAAQVKLHLSHLCCLGARNWPLVPQALARIAAARATGQPVTFDQHPYTAASTTLSQVLPPWVVDGGPAAMAERLSDRQTRDRIRTEIAGRGRMGWENYAGLAGWDAIHVAGLNRPENQPLLGRTIGAVAAERGLDPFDVAADLLIAENGSVAMVMLGLYDDASILAILHAPGGAIGTDGVIAAHPHPRLYGSTARVLGRYARDLAAEPGSAHGAAAQTLTLEAAVARLSRDAMSILGFADRGTLTPGSVADLVVFDPATIADRATYAHPKQHPAGIRDVIVNGRPVLRGGRDTGARPGRVVRRPM